MIEQHAAKPTKGNKSTHKNPISRRLLHLIGLSLYFIGFFLIVGYYSSNSPSSSPYIYTNLQGIQF